MIITPVTNQVVLISEGAKQAAATFLLVYAVGKNVCCRIHSWGFTVNVNDVEVARVNLNDNDSDPLLRLWREATKAILKDCSFRHIPCPYHGIAYNKVPGYIEGYGCPVCKGIGCNHVPLDMTEPDDSVDLA